jgi:hypothetical protein
MHATESCSKSALPRRYEGSKQAPFDGQTFLDSAGVARNDARLVALYLSGLIA